MFKKLISIFVLIAFSLSYFSQFEAASHFSIKNKNNISKSVQELTKTLLNESNTADCSDSDCNHHDHHGSHHCSGLCTMTIHTNNMALFLTSNRSSEIVWSLSNHYQIPFLDPSLKPPSYI